MKKGKEKDRRKRSCFLKNEIERRLLKSIFYNETLIPDVRKKANGVLSALPRSSSLSRIRKRCVLTGRGRFIVGKWNISRMMFLQMAKEGFFPGLRKSSW